jgi:predicted RND superfamily exporter protein
VVDQSESQQEWIRWLSWGSVVFSILFLPFGLWSVLHLPIGSAGVHEWLPEGRPERARYERFTSEFGNDQVVLMSWDGCNLSDPRLPEMQRRLQGQPQYSTLVDSLIASDAIQQQLMREPLSLTQPQVQHRLQGVLIGKEETSVIIAKISQRGVEHQNDTIEMIRLAADATPGLGRQSLRLAGTVFESYAVDAAAEASLKQLVLPSSILGFAVCWVCLGSVRRALVVLVLAGFGQMLAVAMVYYSGSRFSAVLIVLPTLVFMLSLSGAVHLMNYLVECRKLGIQHPGVAALMKGWKPCTLSTVTTMLGMGSLITSQLAPVRQFGAYSAIGLGIATLILLLGFPFMAERFCLQRTSKYPRTIEPHNASSPSSRFSSRYLTWIVKEANLISIAGFVFLIASSLGLISLQASTLFTDMFPKDSRVNQDMAWFEENLGPIATVEVLLRFSDGVMPNELDRAGLVNKVTDYLRQQPCVGGVLSAASFLPTWSEASSIRAISKRAVLRQSIERSLPQLQSSGLVGIDPDAGPAWRIQAKVSATSNMDYGQLTQTVSAAVNEVLRSESAPPQVIAECTGLSPVMHETQVSLISDLGYSFLSAFALITPLMMYIVRSVRGGLLLMLPNVLPVTLAFGCMGWLGLRLDIAGILTASIALGIAVDDTLHFICWYMDELKQGHSRVEAVTRTLSNCSTAMVHTTAISCLSMVPFLFAEFLPTQQFAKLMIVMLTGAIAGDLILLPALLLSPLGKVIKPTS